MYSEQAKDEIRIEGLEVYARHGVYPEETKNGQYFYVNAILYINMRRAGREDNLERTINYGTVCHFITDWMQENTCLLLEAVAERLSQALLLEYDALADLELEIQKPHAPIRLPFGNVSVKVRRGWHRAYIAVGSNLGNRKTHILSGIQALKVHPLIKLKKVSKMIVTEPYGGVEQEDFLNGALEIETLLEPEELLEVLHQVEDAEGRKRTLRWGPRTLDLDILFYDRICYESENLVIPHVDLENRVFVLKPMSEIAPYFRHPINHKTMMGLLKELEQKTEEDGDRPSSVEISLES
ncbi:MAG: 2-amino-4-hydroxy-6-hydroxymethyldihydropteridine diphosphokinase [Lachnospiraceae bacterium]|nr:2-amino-4-hydroxy-6-hydroxymethyldihydropteridine diphosphokinase [uncultured Acetatifactor sp.]MCI9571116.1 2-amino-4-hydroxy-6-hydroxymethyldihydropteridine diphosphokinase [Lachnospiraceae bacterium]